MAGEQAGGGDAQQQPQSSIFQRILQMFLWYQLISWGVRSFTKSNTPDVNENVSESLLQNRDVDTSAINEMIGPWQSGETKPNYVLTSKSNHKNYWKPGTPYNMRFDHYSH